MLRALRFAAAVTVFVGCDCSGPELIDGGGRPDTGVDSGAAMVDAGTERDASTDAGRADRDGGGMRICDAAEACGDGLDNDCDTFVDEGCACAPGEVTACFGGDPGHRGQGVCSDGTMLCEGDVEFGRWGPCEGDVTEQMEICDAAGLDEDCDGAANEGCECADGDPGLRCGMDTGECASGLQRCVDGSRTECEGAVGPAIEVCNGLDDDCDGFTDEGITRACGISVGVCRMGTEICVAGAWGMCSGGASPSDELCDGLDNDCDGSIDEDVRRTCGSDVGACVAGIETCAGGLFGMCMGRVDPIPETCNGADDDCDGSIDEDLDRACGTDTGRCVAGTEMCVGGAYGACMGSTGPIDEACDGLLDEDCDGTVDEGCTCTTGSMRTCGTDVGRCSAGTQTCDAAGAWGPCSGSVDPRTETCDGTDDDCDGMLDEGCDCITGTVRSCGSDIGECVAGAETCDSSGRWGPCLGETPPSAEVCNMRDDDCDTMVDEGGVCPRFPPTAMCPGAITTVQFDTVMLTASGVDPDGGPVTYLWSVVVAPVGSSATPSPTTAGTTSFTPDVAGSYTLRFCVTDDELVTTCCTVSLTATSSCMAPAAPSLTVCGTSWDRRPVVEFAPLASGQTVELFYDGSPSPYATISMAGQNYHRPAAALGPGGPPPGRAATIHARACLASAPTCCSVGPAVPVAMVEACTTPVAPSASNIVFSEYVTNGDGPCPGPACEAGEAIEITNLSHCPVALAGHHFAYCNPSSCGAFRWMDFGPTDIVPPRGVYVAIRNRAASTCPYPFFGPNDPNLFGLYVSALSMMGSGLASGWFENGGGGMSVLRIATGPWSTITGGTTLEIISPYLGSAPECSSIGFDAMNRCGDISPVATPTDRLTPNQLGRLWRPCDAVLSPVPAGCM